MFFHATAPTEIYTLSLHDALPISVGQFIKQDVRFAIQHFVTLLDGALADGDRKSTRLNSSHPSISYAVFCLKKKKNILFIIYFFIICSLYLLSPLFFILLLLLNSF